MSTVNQDELKAIKILKFTGKECEWDHWSEKFVALARARGFEGYCWLQSRHPEQTKILTRRSQMAAMNKQMQKEKKRLRQANGNAYINLQLSCENYLMTWSPWQKQKNSQMNGQEMHGKD